MHNIEVLKIQASKGKSGPKQAGDHPELLSFTPNDIERPVAPRSG
jgi:hypothetical protein